MKPTATNTTETGARVIFDKALDTDLTVLFADHGMTGGYAGRVHKFVGDVLDIHTRTGATVAEAIEAAAWAVVKNLDTTRTVSIGADFEARLLAILRANIQEVAF